MTTLRTGRLLRRRTAGRSGQGMIEYGLILGLMSVWIVTMFIALKPIFTERFAGAAMEQYAGEGRAQLIAELEVTYFQSGGEDDGGLGGDT